MAKFLMHREEWEVTELNFIAVERAWPAINGVLISLDPLAAASAGIGVLAAGLMEMENFSLSAHNIDPTTLDPKLDREEQIFIKLQASMKKRVLANEMSGISLAVIEVIKEAGLMPEPGENPALPPEVARLIHLMATSTESSASLLPPELREAVGTA